METKLLRVLAERGEMLAEDWLDLVPRKLGDHRDYYQAAALLHANYVGLNTDTGRLGDSVQETAQNFRQICMPKSESFEVYGCTRESWRDGSFEVYITETGILKLDEIDEKAAGARTTLLLVILASVLSAALTYWLTS